MRISVDKFLIPRDVDAALYLLSRMLDLEFGEKRAELQTMYNHINNKKTVDGYEKHQIVSLYREVVG